MRNRVALAVLALFLLAAPASADEIVINASHNEFFVFSTHLETFTIPAGHTIVAATVSGTVSGIPEATLAAGTTLSYPIDGYLVPTLFIASPTAGFVSGSFTFPTSELFRFADGMVIVGSCPLGMPSCNPGQFIENITATLTITTAPEPPGRPRTGVAAATPHGAGGGGGESIQVGRAGLTGRTKSYDYFVCVAPPSRYHGPLAR